MRLEVVPTSFTVEPGSSFRPVFNFTGSDQQVLGDLGLNATNDVTFQIQTLPPNTPGITVTASGEVQVDAAVSPGVQFQVRAVYNDTDSGTISGFAEGVVAVPNSGGLLFQFVQAQSAPVPASTTQLSFIFRDDIGQPVMSVTRPFDGVVVIQGVPVSAVSVVITARDTNGDPLSVITDSVNVVEGTTTTVDLSDATITAP